MPGRWNGRETSRSDSDSDSTYSDGSHHSRSTAPTVHSHESRRPALKYHPTAPPQIHNCWAEPWGEQDTDPRASVETYVSTVPSIEDLDDDLPPFDLPDEQHELRAGIAVPSTPAEFAELFPSSRRLQIRHDDATVDGNMNLRVDTEIRGSEGGRMDRTLYHLRMHDLKNRQFSLRRYCRDSGREVCHSCRKNGKPVTTRRPGLPRSMSNAWSSFRSKSESKALTRTGLNRQDSGYASISEEDLDGEGSSHPSRGDGASPLPTNTTHVEFANYAHVDVKRRGAKTSKRYEFEYWGTAYAWKRMTRRTGGRRETSYRLVGTEDSRAIAHIVPAALTPAEWQEEEVKGGWVPPCSMWISDERILRGSTDVAE